MSRPPQGFFAGEFFKGRGQQLFKATGEFRPPKKGEYYLSGALITTYRAPNDLAYAYWIAKPVETKPCPHCAGTGVVEA